MWRCRCNCAKAAIRVIRGSDLRHRHTNGCAWCACRRKQHALSARDVVLGWRYGSLTTTKYIGGRLLAWECVCECGKTIIVGGYHLISGHSTKCRSCSVKTRYKAKGFHSLSQVNRETMRAKCELCGLVPIRLLRTVPKCYVSSIHGKVHHPNEAVELLESQGGRCANPTCTSPLLFNQGSGKSACLDHDHATGFIRRWFCSACNAAFGYARECSAILRGLAQLASNQEALATS